MDDIKKSKAKNSENTFKNSSKLFLTSFFERVSFHGFSYFTLSHLHKWEKLFWLILVVGSIYFCVDIGLESFDRFQTKSTVATIENDHYYWNATLPSLTVCPMDRISMEKFDDYCEYRGITGQDKVEFYLFIHSMANATYINFEHIREFESIKKWKIQPNDYMMLIYNLSVDMTRREAELKVRCVNNLEFIRSMQVLTEFGICYTTNSFVAPKLTPRYLFFGLPLEEDSFYKNEKVYKVRYGNLFDEHMTYSFIGFDNATASFIHSPHEVMSLSKPFIYSEDAFEFRAYSVEVLASENFQKSTTIAQRGCRFLSESNLTHFDVYTKGLCLQECRMLLAYKFCGCIPHFYPNRIANPKPVCSYQTLKSCFPRHIEYLLEFHDHHTGETEYCNCVPNCASSNIIIESTQLLRGTKALLGSTASLVAIKKYATLRIVRRVLFTFTDLLVSIGGTAGLFLGFSVLGVVEILYFFSLRLFWFILGKR